MSGTVAWIAIAPVKGLALVHPEAVQLGTAGVRENRRFHLIDARGRLVSARRHGSLLQVVPRYDAVEETLGLAFPDGTVVEDRIDLGDPVRTVFYGRPVAGRLVEGPWSAALSRHAGEALRLARPDAPGAGNDRGRSGAVSLLGTAALAPLGTAAGAAAPLDGRRFRMLFGIDGLEPHAEDAWIGRRVRIGEATVVPRGHVGRCAITCRDPDTGVRDVDTLRALRATRGDAPTTEPLALGIHGEVAEPGRVRLGDPVIAG